MFIFLLLDEQFARLYSNFTVLQWCFNTGHFTLLVGRRLDISCKYQLGLLHIFISAYKILSSRNSGVPVIFVQILEKIQIIGKAYWTFSKYIERIITVILLWNCSNTSLISASFGFVYQIKKNKINNNLHCSCENCWLCIKNKNLLKANVS